jgi:ectoine hydroxylase
MQLSPSQIAEFEREGFVALPNLFTPAEVALLRREADVVYAQKRQEVVREKDGATPRTAFAAHTYNEACRRLGRHPRLIRPVEQILGGKLYMHQFKINAKAAFDGDVWQWHQDYGTWARDDLMPAPLAMNIALYLDDVSEFNGPLWFIPRSHKKGVLAAGHDVTTTSYPLWTLDQATIARLVDEGSGIYSSKGPAGTALLFHANLVHASPPNISPWHRVAVYLSLCRVDNHIRQFKRPDWIAHRDFSPIEPLADDCLTDLIRPQAA